MQFRKLRNKSGSSGIEKAESARDSTSKIEAQLRRELKRQPIPDTQRLSLLVPWIEKVSASFLAISL